jgi:3-hydroxyisobutyrate dehydrogenase
MTTTAVLGLGLLGAGFAEHMLDLGHSVRVWNRTASRCAPLAAKGAVAAATPAEAVRGADYVHLVLTADAAVDDVIAQLRSGLSAGAPILDHSTNLPAGVAARSPRLRAEGVRYLHAPVFMGPGNAREGTGMMLVSGPSDEVAALTPYLGTLTGAVRDAGERPEQAAALKLVGNSVLLMMAAAMGDAFKVGAAAGLTSADVMGLFQAFSPSPAGMGQRILGSARNPAGFEATMARKDAGLMIEATGADALLLVPAVAAALDAAIAAGRGAEDFTALFRPADA